MSDKPNASRAVEALGQAAAAGTGVVLGGPVGAVVGAAIAPAVTELVARAWNELRGRQEANATHVVALAATQTHRDVETILQTVREDRELSSLFFAAVRAGAATFDEDKIAALATCLANGLDDSTRIDQEAVIVRALAELDPIHVRVLAKINAGAMEPIQVHLFLLGDAMSLKEKLQADDVSGAVLSTLERHGLAFSEEVIEGARGGKYASPGRGTRKVSITPFGRLCLERLGHVKVRR